MAKHTLKKRVRLGGKLVTVTSKMKKYRNEYIYTARVYVDEVGEQRRATEDSPWEAIKKLQKRLIYKYPQFQWELTVESSESETEG